MVALSPFIRMRCALKHSTVLKSIIQKRYVYVKPFEDLIKEDEEEFLKFDYTPRTEELLKPMLMNGNQVEIMFSHISKNDFISKYWKTYYDTHDPVQYWAYGIPEVVNEYRRIGGEFAPYAWVLGALATACSKEFVSVDGFQSFYVILFGIEFIRRVWGDKVVNFYKNKEIHRANMTQRILDEPAEAYKKIMDSLNSQLDYQYVRLMLANYENDLEAMETEIKYRTHLKSKYDEFIKRLRYQEEITQLKKYYNSLLLRTWLFPQVEKAITPDVKEKVLDECLAILKSKADAKLTKF